MIKEHQMSTFCVSVRSGDINVAPIACSRQDYSLRVGLVRACAGPRSSLFLALLDSFSSVFWAFLNKQLAM